MLARIIKPVNITDFQGLCGTLNPQALGDRSFKCAAPFFEAAGRGGGSLTGNSAMTSGQLSPLFTTHRVETMAPSRLPKT